MFIGSLGPFVHTAIHPASHPSVHSSLATTSPHCVPGDGVLTALPAHVLSPFPGKRALFSSHQAYGPFPPLPFTPHAGALK